MGLAPAFSSIYGYMGSPMHDLARSSDWPRSWADFSASTKNTLSYHVGLNDHNMGQGKKLG